VVWLLPPAKLLNVSRLGQVVTIKGLLMAKTSNRGNVVLLVRLLLGNNVVVVMIVAMNTILETPHHPGALRPGLGIAGAALTVVELTLTLAVKMVDMLPLLHPVALLHGNNPLRLLVVVMVPMVAIQLLVMEAIHRAWELLLD
jgi:hypothetical protein